MYKLLGCFMIIASSAILGSRKNIILYSTYKLLSETEKIARQVKIQIQIGRPYADIFNRIPLSDYSFYKNFDFSNRTEFSEKIITNRYINKSAAAGIAEFINELGKQNRDSETEFIENSAEIFALRAKNIKEEYEQNKRLNIVFSISIGCIISLLII